MIKNDNSPDRKKYLGILSTRERKINPLIQEEYDLHTDEYVDYIKKAYNKNIAQKYIKEYLAERITRYKEYKYYYPNDWAEWKKYQLYIWLTTVAYIVAFIKLYQQDYKFVGYSDWTIMLKYLANPEHYRTTKDINNIYVNFVKSSEYRRYRCKIVGKPYLCNLLEINYFKTGYISINEGSISVNFSDVNNNCEYVHWVFQTIDSLSRSLPQS